MSRFNRWKRSIYSVFDSHYKLIDTEKRIYNGKSYEPKSDKFFNYAKKIQEKYGLSQDNAVKLAHDTLDVKYTKQKIAKSSRVNKNRVDKLNRILDEWIEQDDLDYDYDYVIDEYSV